MRRVLFLLAATGGAVALAWWLAGLPGTVAMSGFGYAVEAAAPVAILALGLGLAVLVLLLRLLLALLWVPRGWRLRAAARRRRQGDAAVAQALVALAAGEAAPARRAAAKAREKLGETAQTLLLDAESARLAGDLAAAQAGYIALAARPDGAFLGLRGQFRLAVARADWAEAGRLSEQAEALQPGGNWLRDARLRVAEETGRWARAGRLAGPDLPAELIATAAAQAEADPQAAARLAKQAWRANPGFPPAVLAHAAALRRAGHDRAAETVVQEAWRLAPHPDLAAFLLEPADDAAARLRVATTLSNAHPDHVETQFLLGRLHLAAGELREARHHAGRARELAEPTRRVLVLLADLAAAEGGDPAALLRAAATAPADPAWRCDACGTAQPRWHLVCPACHAQARMSWTTGATRPALAIEGPG